MADGTRPMHEADPALYARMVQHYHALVGRSADPMLEVDREFREAERKWAQDCDAIGRVLRAHLFVEHFLNDYLGRRNPNLPRGAIGDLRFRQKLDLIGDGQPWIAALVPGLLALNRLRNDLGHNLDASIDQRHTDEILKVDSFEAWQQSVGMPVSRDCPRIDLVEYFARFVGRQLHAESSPALSALGEALHRALADQREGRL